MLIKNVVRRLRRVVLCAGILAIVLSFATPAHAATPDTTASIVNVHIGGYLDPHNAALLSSSLKKATQDHDSIVIVQLDSHGVADVNLDKLIRDIDATTPVVAFWVGPTNVTYDKALNSLVHSADVVGAASKRLAKKSDATIVAPSLREFIAKLDNKPIAIGEDDTVTLDMGCSAKEISSAKKDDECYGIKLTGKEKFQLTNSIRFEKLSPIANLGHALISPGFAVGIFVMGLCLLAFEFFAASVGVASIAGMIAAICGLYGFGHLPTHWWAVVVIALGIFAMVIDVQAGGVGFYTIVGTILLIVGSLFATPRGSSFEVSFISVAIIVIMALLFMLGAIPSLIRTRFGTPTIGREDFIGEEGVADGDIDPEGNIKLRGASWKARTNHATPIKDGEKCKVTKIEGIILEVEPLVGAAVDYREKRRKN
jgi:membrane-bound serine protease (ClpP class)